MLVQVSGNARSRNLTLVHPDVKPVSARNLPQSPHCLLGKQSNFSDLLLIGIVIGVDVAVRTDQQVAGVVRE